MSTFVNLSNTKGRNKNYKKVLERIIKDGICPFCIENLAKYHRKQILRNRKYWILTENMYSYPGTKHHLLVIHKIHIEKIEDISKKAWKELLLIIRAEVKKRGIRGGTFYMRFGDTDYTGASVKHLHANLISPDINTKDRKPLIIRVG